MYSLLSEVSHLLVQYPSYQHRPPHHALLHSNPLHPSPPLSTPLHPSPPLSTPLHPDLPRSTPIHASLPRSTSLHPAPPCSTLLHPAPPCPVYHNSMVCVIYLLMMLRCSEVASTLLSPLLKCTTGNYTRMYEWTAL